MNKNRDSSQRFIYNPNKPVSVYENHISSLLVDHNDILWVGTFGGGLNKVIRQTKPFGLHLYNPNNPNG